MITIKTPAEIEALAEGGKILSGALWQIIAKAKPGVTTLELDKIGEDYITSHGAKPSFKMEKGYFHTTCLCVNDIVVHGIPVNKPLVNGDVLGIDIGAFYKNLHTDASWSIIVGETEKDKEKRKFLNNGQLALEEAIKKCVVGNHIGDISQTIQQIVEGGGYSCVKQLVGHGVGYALHEDPEIPCYLRGEIAKTPEIKEGMVLAIEVIYNMGGSSVVYGNDDGWTIVTRDGLPSGLFEHTVVVTSTVPRILTSP